MAFGYVVDDEGPDKRAAGGAGPFALSLAERPIDELAHAARCPACRLLAEPLACVGIVATPIPSAVEQWLVARLPEDIESLPGFLVRKAIGDYGYDGSFGKALRDRDLLEAPGPFTRHFGPFFRRFTVSSEQLLDGLFGAGDVEPAHALATLSHLGGIAVDGRVLLKMDEGALYGEVVNDVAARPKRTACTIAVEPGDSEALIAMKRYLRALWTGFALDVPVRLFGEPIVE